MNFWGQIISEIDTLDAHLDNQRSNFSGEYSFSNPKFAKIAANYLQTLFPGQPTHIDFGSSRGTLTAELLKLGWNSYAIDGTSYGIKNHLLDIPLDRYAVFDLRQSLVPFNLPKFEITTSFELTEHIPKPDIEKVIVNIASISKTHICSVHFGGEEQGSHYNIQPTSWWIGLLTNFGTVSKLDDFKALLPFEESDFLRVDFD